MEIASPIHRLEWGVARQTAPGESVTGDAHLLLPHQRGLLLAVIDGSGHGPEAAHAAAWAVATLRGMPECSVLEQLNRCHAALARTRGVVMTLADFNRHDQTLTLCGVGNVEAVLFRAETAADNATSESALLRGGVVGAQLPAPYAAVVPVHAGDVLVMATDGVRTDFSRNTALHNPPQRAADQLLRQHARGTDDALVLVARFPTPADE